MSSINFPCLCGRQIIVDEEDYTKIKDYNWKCRGDGKGALKASNNFTISLVHKIFSSKELKDHIDRNSHNCVKSNLRAATQDQNKRNRGKFKNNTTGYKGVVYMKRLNKFMAKIGINKGKVYLGLFVTAKEAALAYNTAAIKYHGEFACLNTF